MLLAKLSETTGVSTASIKYYLREGLLQPGAAVHATRADYGKAHCERLELISVLRQVVGLRIEQIRLLLQAADRGMDTLALLELVQGTVLGVDTVARVDTVEPGVDTVKPVPSPLGDRTIRLRGWPDVESEARSALNAQLEGMRALGIDVPEDVLDTYSAAADQVAALDLRHVEASGSRDALIRTVAVGVHMHSRLLLRMLALAQTSRSIQRYGAAGGITAAPGPPAAAPPAGGAPRTG